MRYFSVSQCDKRADQFSDQDAMSLNDLTRCMGLIENLINRLADADFNWWPFLYLRPEKSTPVSNAVLVKISMHYGAFYGVIFTFLPIFLRKIEFGLMLFLANIVAMTILCFVCCKFIFAAFWNRRAYRLIEESRSGAAP